MASPTANELHVNRPLTNLTVAFMQSADQFIADKVFPNVPVDHKSDSFYRYARESWNRPQAKPRARSTESAGGGWEVETDTYQAERFAFHKDIDDQDRANQDAQFNIDRDAAEFTAYQLLLTREAKFVESFFGTGIWSRNLTGVSGTPSTNQFKQWDAAGSTPISDIKNEILAQSLLTGFRPNTLVLGPQVQAELEEHPDILDRIKYTERGLVSTDLLASLFGVQRILTPFPIQNTGKEGAAEANAFLYGKAALLVYAAPNAGLMIPSAGYTFNWRRYMGTSALTPITKKFRMEEITSDRVESELFFDMKVVAPEMGTYFASAVA
jgi:hypothetical protein